MVLKSVRFNLKIRLGLSENDVDSIRPDYQKMCLLCCSLLIKNVFNAGSNSNTSRVSGPRFEQRRVHLATAEVPRSELA